jgi:hypothetical protein
MTAAPDGLGPPRERGFPSATRVSATVPAPVYKVSADLARPAGITHRAAAAARGESMQSREVLLQQRVRCIAEKFQERTASEAEPLSRERIREVIRVIVAELEEERLREADG